MSIYSRSGDEGITSLGNGTRVSKSDPCIEAFGTMDEAITAIGFARVGAEDPLLCDALSFIQQRLFNCSAALVAACGLRADAPGTDSAQAAPGAPTVSADDIAALEALIDQMMTAGEPMRGFVLPGGSETAARCHLARVAVRQAERRIAALDELHLAREVVSFVNRASDALYAASRYANVQEGSAEESWDPDSPGPRQG